MPIWLVHQGLSLGRTGVVVGLFIMATRGGAVIAVGVVNILGLKRSIVSATAAAALILSVAWQTATTSFAIWATLACGIGFAFSVATLSLRTIVAAESSSASRVWGFSILNMAVNAGSGVGPILGGFVVARQPNALPLVAAVLAGVATIGASMLADVDISGADDHSSAPLPGSPAGTAILRRMLPFLLITSLTWVAYAQFFNVFPLYATDRVDPTIIGALFAVNAVLIVLFQLPVTGALQRIGSGLGRDSTTVRLANVLLAVSLMFFAPAVTKFWWLAFVGVVLFTFAEMVWSPGYDALVALVVGPRRQTFGYAIAGILWGGAEAGGTYLGLTLVGSSARIPGAGIWVFGSAAGLAIIASVGLGLVSNVNLSGDPEICPAGVERP